MRHQWEYLKRNHDRCKQCGLIRVYEKVTGTVYVVPEFGEVAYAAGHCIGNISKQIKIFADEIQNSVQSKAVRPGE